MPTNNLAGMGDRELLKLFAVSGGDSGTRRAKQVRAELERRGYVYDAQSKMAVTCEEWNKWHNDQRRDCDEEARHRQRDGGG
jgi:hypothetical protein